MVETIYKKEIEEIKIILNSRTILQNLSYKINKDKNAIEFYKNLIKNIKKYDKFNEEITEERMSKYYFENDFNAMYEIITLFYLGLKKDDRLQKASGINIRKCCNLFPDHTGELILKIIGYYPIMKLFKEKLEILDFLDKKVDLNKKIMGQTLIEEMEESLFSEKRHGINFREDNFIDYKLRNKYIEFIEIEQKEKIKELNLNIKNLIDIFNNSDNLEESLILIGIVFWDSQNNKEKQSTEELKKAFNALFENIEEKNNFNIEKIKIILKDEIKKEINKNLNIEIDKTKNKSSFNYFLKLTSENLTDEEIKKIETIFFIKRDYEIENIKYFEKKNNIYVFKAKIELS